MDSLLRKIIILGVLITAIFALIRFKPKTITDDPAWKILQTRLDETQQRLELAEGQLRKFRIEAATRPPVAQTVIAPLPRSTNQVVPSGDSADLAARIDDLEARVQRAESFDNSVVDGFNLLARRGVIPPTQETLTELTSLITETNAPLKDRLDALKLLGKFKAITPEMVPLLADWWQSDTNHGVREQIFRQFKGTKIEEMKPLYLQGILADQPRDIREAALKNLMSFADDPRVAQVLATIVTEDVDEKLRFQAQQLLFGKDATGGAKKDKKIKPARTKPTKKK